MTYSREDRVVGRQPAQVNSMFLRKPVPCMQMIQVLYIKLTIRILTFVSKNFIFPD